MELFDFTMNTGPELQHSQISRFFGAIVVVAFSDCNRKDKPLDSHDPGRFVEFYMSQVD